LQRASGELIQVHATFVITWEGHRTALVKQGREADPELPGFAIR
jgi:hypothetical protein